MARIREDILGKSKEKLQLKLPELNDFETEIYTILKGENLTIDELVFSTNHNIIEVTTTLTMMGLKGIVVDIGGKFYVS